MTNLALQSFVYWLQVTLARIVNPSSIRRGQLPVPEIDNFSAAGPDRISPIMTSLDLVIDYHRLDTEFFKGYVRHTTFHSDASQGGRQLKVVKKWYRDRELGRGSFGTVFLERSGKVEQRAVKEIAKDKNSGTPIDYKRELMAMAVLAKVRDMEAS